MAATRLGEKLRMLRQARGWTQADVARRYGQVKRNQVSNYETGGREPRIAFIAWACRTYEVTFDQLLDDAVDLPADATGGPSDAT
ncbi:MAG: hypothetical protein SangKO_100020 [Sandaracinaceae bacterium]